MNDLTANLDRLHTTQMGAKRILRNLDLQVDDIVTWCKDVVKSADSTDQQGKNWYVYKNDVVITINAHSYTIITAHPIGAKVRVIRESDYACQNFCIERYISLMGKNRHQKVSSTIQR